ncbi:patatin-like phospholipase family protein [Sphingomonas naphthae]|uniref:Patatin-like phospholipase family protein n=1 Tax=Sphingomonas naphthae TaxID=1813468 RepID=A0ABY7TK19_9SPHN|nr:patatin-like phospholipase family protein [Sphingomonas naphthae]WCT73296.1 patatin-like phospholipase family protein [Sphingomonas naphthae]
MTPITLALGGGAALGWAHIGVIRTLQDAYIPIGAVAGTSMGAIVGACLAAERLDHLEEIARTANRRTVLGFLDPALNRHGLIGGRRVVREMIDHIGPETLLENLSIPAAMVAADLMTGEEVRLTHGPLIPAVRASIAVPSLFTPVKVDGRWLIDGGMVANVPVAAARAIGGAATLVAVDLFADYAGHAAAAMPDGRPRNALKTGRAGFLMLMRAQGMLTVRLNPPDALITPAIGHISTGAFLSAEELIEAGRVAAQAALPMIRAAITAQKSGNPSSLLNH